MYINISYQAVYMESSLAHKYIPVVFIKLFGNVCIMSDRFMVMTIAALQLLSIDSSFITSCRGPLDVDVNVTKKGSGYMFMTEHHPFT